MKSGEFSSSPLHRIVTRGVEFMVRRLVEVADPQAEAIYCIRQVELQVKSGDITDDAEIANAIRQHILARERKKTVNGPMATPSPIPAAISLTVGGMSDLERAAAAMYYAESLNESVISSRLSITPMALRGMLTKLRDAAVSFSITANVKQADSNTVAV